MLRTLKRDRRNQSSQDNGSGTFSPSMLGGRNEAEAWTPPPLPDLPQFREPESDAPPPPEPKARKTKRSEKPKDMPPLGAMPRVEPLPPEPAKSQGAAKKPLKAAKPAPIPPSPLAPDPFSPGPLPPGPLPPSPFAGDEPKRTRRSKLEIPPESLDPGPIDGDEPPIVEERPRQPTAATVGALLAQTRSGFGQDIEEVSSALRIRPVFLRAIEESRYEDLPGLTYGVGFVRSYAHYLGLDVNDCVERFKDEAAGIDRTPNLNFPTPVPEAKVPTGAIILVSLLLAGLAYLVWTYVSRDGGLGQSEAVVSETASPVVGAASTSEPASASGEAVASTASSETDGASSSASTAETTGSDTAGLTAATTAAAGGADTTGSPPTGSDAGDNVSISNSAAAAAGGAVAGGSGTVLFTEAASASQPADPSVSGTGAAYSGPRVVLRATQDSWVQVRNASNESIFTRVLRAGDTYDVPDQPGLSLLTGNAGGLVILVDGQEVPKLGRSGQVRRNVSLSPDSLKSN